MLRRSIKSLALFLISIIGVAFLNFGIVEQIIIPDPCLYHTKETTFLWNLFYTLSGAEGYHPFPTLLNFILTLIVGVFVGFWLTRRVNKR